MARLRCKMTFVDSTLFLFPLLLAGVFSAPTRSDNSNQISSFEENDEGLPDTPFVPNQLKKDYPYAALMRKRSKIENFSYNNFRFQDSDSIRKKFTHPIRHHKSLFKRQIKKYPNNILKDFKRQIRRYSKNIFKAFQQVFGIFHSQPTITVKTYMERSHSIPFEGPKKNIRKSQNEQIGEYRRTVDYDSTDAPIFKSNKNYIGPFGYIFKHSDQPDDQQKMKAKLDPKDSPKTGHDLTGSIVSYSSGSKSDQAEATTTIGLPLNSREKNNELAETNLSSTNVTQTLQVTSQSRTSTQLETSSPELTTSFKEEYNRFDDDSSVTMNDHYAKQNKTSIEEIENSTRRIPIVLNELAKVSPAPLVNDFMITKDQDGVGLQVNDELDTLLEDLQRSKKDLAACEEKLQEKVMAKVSNAVQAVSDSTRNNSKFGKNENNSRSSGGNTTTTTQVENFSFNVVRTNTDSIDDSPKSTNTATTTAKTFSFNPIRTNIDSIDDSLKSTNTTTTAKTLSLNPIKTNTDSTDDSLKSTNTATTTVKTLSFNPIRKNIDSNNDSPKSKDRSIPNLELSDSPSVRQQPFDTLRGLSPEAVDLLDKNYDVQILNEMGAISDQDNQDLIPVVNDGLSVLFQPGVQVLDYSDENLPLSQGEHIGPVDIEGEEIKNLVEHYRKYSSSQGLNPSDKILLRLREDIKAMKQEVFFCQFAVNSG